MTQIDILRNKTKQAIQDNYIDLGSDKNFLTYMIDNMSDSEFMVWKYNHKIQVAKRLHH